MLSSKVDGLIWSQPVADVLSLEVVIFMLLRKIKKTDFTGAEEIPPEEKQEV